VKLLLFGAHGQIGRDLCRAARPPGLQLLPLGRGEVDITEEGAVAAAIAEAAPDLVVNLAAYTAVDRAESEPERAFAVNSGGAKGVAEACRRFGAPLIHLSTDYVFDGTKAGAYLEDDPARPLGVYGASKEAGEEAIRAALSEHVILRTAWVFGAFGANFVKTVLRLARGDKPLRIVGDQIGCPTPAAAIAAALTAIARRIGEGRGVWGTFHFAGSPPVSWHGFAEAILDLAAPALGRRPPVEARRPGNSVLDCGKIAAAYSLKPPSWRGGLAAVIGELFDLEAGRSPAPQGEGAR
jgi:dTDP-4-dehydrorhamnose reductase